MGTIAENLERVRARIAAACGRAGRDESEVTLVAVTKTVGDAEVAELYRLGVRDFGENRVVDGLGRKQVLGAVDSRWHLIGHLQRNKAASALEGGYGLIHSVESSRLVEVLDRECGRLGMRGGVLLEVNVSGEESKYGVSPGELPALAEKAAGCANLRLLGLMTMAPFTDEPETARPFFRRLATLREETALRIGRPLPHLSMGMTGDFEIAVEEGATLVRIGTALFAR
jgi:pyridoxal phosphate enzyme (YggS family)